VYETIHFQDKQEKVDAFYGEGMDESERAAFLSENGIDYVFYGRAERGLGRFKPAEAEYLTERYRNEDAVIYQVVER
jgi:hypothetical protein